MSGTPLWSKGTAGSWGQREQLEIGAKGIQWEPADQQQETIRQQDLGKTTATVPDDKFQAPEFWNQIRWARDLQTYIYADIGEQLHRQDTRSAHGCSCLRPQHFNFESRLATCYYYDLHERIATASQLAYSGSEEVKWARRDNFKLTLLSCVCTRHKPPGITKERGYATELGDTAIFLIDQKVSIKDLV